MNQEQRKEYNKKYYETNKEEIFNKYYRVKVTCEFCKCLVSKNNLKKHQSYPICMTRTLELLKKNLRQLELENEKKKILSSG
jgi:hypothetical protein